MSRHSILEYTNSRDNNYNLIRFIAATLVLFSHSFPLSGVGGEPFFKYIEMTGGTIAVDIFFISSGFLVANSFFGRNNIIAFVWARFLRIYPALIVAMIFCVLIVGLFFTDKPIFIYLNSDETHTYFLRNITLFYGVEFNLPGVFLDIPYKNAVNGSIWTLPYEVKMYAYLAIFGTFLKYFQKCFGRDLIKKMLLSFGVLALVSHIINHFHFFISVHSMHLLAMFFMGVAFYAYRDIIYLSSNLFFLFSLVILFSILNKDLFFVMYSVLLPYLVFYLAYVPKGVIRKFNNLGDYSYGIYICISCSAVYCSVNS